ncbi:hypothetical protein [Krasilnikovia sp. MM14-A1004]|uniref:hypothetical protein n=1 Tax=Krasilnikovia sp. MM14-A1004 TaxID=3373541 RepID=UPI00399D20CD
MRRRLLTAAATMVSCAVVFAGGAAAPAFAATTHHEVHVSGTAHIKDDEWRHDDIGNHKLARQTLRLPTDGFIHWTPCQGREVTANFEVHAKLITGDPKKVGWARVHASLWLLEGVSCNSHDVDAKKAIDIDVPPNGEVTQSLTAVTGERNSEDYATVTFKVEHDLVND